MKNFPLTTLICILSGIFCCNGQGLEKGKPGGGYEKIIKDYFAGWAKKDWNLVSRTGHQSELVSLSGSI